MSLLVQTFARAGRDAPAHDVDPTLRSGPWSTRALHPGRQGREVCSSAKRGGNLTLAPQSPFGHLLGCWNRQNPFVFQQIPLVQIQYRPPKPPRFLRVFRRGICLWEPLGHFRCCRATRFAPPFASCVAKSHAQRRRPGRPAPSTSISRCMFSAVLCSTRLDSGRVGPRGARSIAT